MGFYLQPALGREHSAGRGHRSRSPCPSGLAQTVRPRPAPSGTEPFRAGFRLNRLDEKFPKDQLPLLAAWGDIFHLGFGFLQSQLVPPGLCLGLAGCTGGRRRPFHPPFYQTCALQHLGAANGCCGPGASCRNRFLATKPPSLTALPMDSTDCGMN